MAAEEERLAIAVELAIDRASAGVERLPEAQACDDVAAKEDGPVVEVENAYKARRWDARAFLQARARRAARWWQRRRNLNCMPARPPVLAH